MSGLPQALVIPLEPAPEPLELLPRFASLPLVALLDGASDRADLGRFSYLAADPLVTLDSSAAEWSAAQSHLRQSIRGDFPHDSALPPFQGGWIGWLSYELGTAFDRMPRATRDDLGTPDIALSLYDWVIAWDHVAGKAWLISSGVDASGATNATRADARAREILAYLSDPDPILPQSINPSTPTRVALSAVPIGAFVEAPAGLSGDFTPTDYRATVARVIEQIGAGDLFQANLSQRFLAPFRGDPLTLYRAMRARAAAPMAAYLGHTGRQILSMSPELFLRYNAHSRKVETRPIKGTRPRAPEFQRDTDLAAELLASDKDRAENVMIVDLLRNDLSRVCSPESVRVPALCRLDTHAAVHHLVSIVTGRLRAEHDALDLLAATFPGGSITGAPKLRATELLAELEAVARGVYCGAIGWVGCDGSMELSVAIRTITLVGGVAAIHAGGGITARSDPDEEYRETLDKARALVAAVAEAG